MFKFCCAGDGEIAATSDKNGTTKTTAAAAATRQGAKTGAIGTRTGTKTTGTTGAAGTIQAVGFTGKLIFRSGSLGWRNHFGFDGRYRDGLALDSHRINNL